MLYKKYNSDGCLFCLISLTKTVLCVIIYETCRYLERKKKRKNTVNIQFSQSLGRNVAVTVYLHTGQYTIAHPESVYLFLLITVFAKLYFWNTKSDKMQIFLEAKTERYSFEYYYT